MCRRVIAALLILGWISLSGFDVVEDLDEAPAQTQISKASNDRAPGSKRAMGPLANNIIELAPPSKQTTIEPVVFTQVIFHFALSTALCKYSQLHKLFHVFLI
jgi:hypothetical protein